MCALAKVSDFVAYAKRTPDKNPASSSNAGTPSGVFNGSGGSLPSRSSSQPNQPDWRPDSDGNLIAEQGDNIETLAKYLNITRASAQLMIDKQAIEYESKGSKNIKEGSKLTLDNVYTRSIKNVSDVDYNCWGAAVAGSKGRMIQQGVGIPSGDIFDNILKRDYFPINSSTNLKFGASVFRFVEPSTNIVQHGAVFYGLDHALNIYVYTKNGQLIAYTLEP